MTREVTAHSNPLIKSIKALKEKKARRAEGRFIAEGLRILTEARESGALPAVLLFTAEAARHPLAATLIAAVDAAGGDSVRARISSPRSPAATIRRR